MYQKLKELIANHDVNGTWCYGCGANVGRRPTHLAEVILAKYQIIEREE